MARPIDRELALLHARPEAGDEADDQFSPNEATKSVSAV